MAEVFWHNLKKEEVVRILRSDARDGLSEKEVELRRREFGKNKLPETDRLSKWKIFANQFRSPLIYILIIAGIITLVLKEFTDSVVIFGAVFLNAAVGYLQENKASQALKKLRVIVKHTSKVLRNGNLKIVSSEDLVPGDIIVLSAGDKVPADGRILECCDLRINEMSLTGEWVLARKKSEVLKKEIPLADRDNMVYMGTIVEEGRGRVIVVGTGLQTEMGKIAQTLKETKEEKTPYQRKIIYFSRIVGIVIGIVCFFIFIEGIIKGRGFVEMFTTAVAVAVAAIPEGLPVAITVILALGMERILKKKGLVRKLSSAETLGSTSIIATDKTGTLTEGKMKVVEIIGDKVVSLKAAVLTSEAFIENPNAPRDKWIVRGRPTERALLEAGLVMGVDKRKDLAKKEIAQIPFNSKNKFAAALYQEADRKILYVCGAPEKILERCVFDRKEEKDKLEKKLIELTQKGLRVVGTAQRIFFNEDHLPIEKLCYNLTFSGFIALQDPIRKDAKEAIRICQQAGMRPIIVTGDHKFTAQVVAKELDIKAKDENILEGKDLNNISDKEFEERLDRITIYARVEPCHKTKIIEAWQNRGEVVAMTGDGINDAPALKRADIGVALGSGTEVAKDVSDLILLNDSFSIIVAAIEEGRAIIDNIRKVITYLFSSAFTEVLVIGTALFGGWPLPILAGQILWVNLIEDGPASLALAFEPKENDLMKQKPAKHKRSLLTKEMKILIFVIGLITDLLLLGLLFWLVNYSGYEISRIRSITFACLAIDSIFYIFSCKSLRKNIWNINILSNKFLLVSWLFEIVCLFGAIYIPYLQMFLKTVPLSFFDWQLIIGIGLVNMVLIEITKYYFISRHQTEV